jgi:predicted ATPase
VKLLALAPAHRLHREQLIATLWPDGEPSAAANNLHQALHVARRRLGPDALRSDGDAIILSAEVDVDAFRATAREALRTGDPAEALELYTGPLLPEDLYEDWAAPARREIEALHARLIALDLPTDTDLPTEPTAFIGRETELAEVARLLRRGPLVTLAGPAGAGKTRLAIEAAARERARSAGDVRLVELAPLADAELIPHAVAAAAGVRLPRGQRAAEALAVALRYRDALVVLDNCEHLVDACARLAAALLRGCPGLVLLATSREPLAIAGEIVYRVPSLTLPRPGHEAESEAVRLFVERSGIPLSNANAADVGRICRRLDGMPLAIELAAAHAATLPLAHLGEAVRALRFERRGGTTRQQTLEAALEWSHRLLSPEEAALLARLSVFAGPFDADAAEAVAGASLDLLSRLVAKSLVVTRDGRYRLLELVRQFAGERLEEREALAERHARWYLALAERAPPATFDAEQGNVRAALAWLLDHDPEAALQLAAALGNWWLLRGRLAEGRRWLEQAVARAPADTASAAAALLRAVPFAVRSGDTHEGDRLAERSLAIHERLGDRRGADAAHTMLGLLAWVRGDNPRARERLESAAGATDAAHALGLVAIATGELERARALLEGVLERLATEREPVLVLGPPPVPLGRPTRYAVMEESQIMFRHVDPQVGAVHVRCNLAVAARLAGDPARAEALLRDAVAQARARAEPAATAHALAALGRLATLEGEPERAAEALEESLALRRELKDVRSICLTLGLLAELAVTEGDRERAHALLERALRLVERAGDRPPRMMILLALARLEPLPQARRRLEQALAVAEELRTNAGRAWTLAALAEIEPRPDRAAALIADARDAFAAGANHWGLDALSRR